MQERATSPAVPPATEVVQRYSPTPGWASRQLKPHAWLFELVLVLGLLLVLNLGLLPARPGYAGLEPNPLWIPVLLAAVRYGYAASLVAALGSGGMYLALVATHGAGVPARELSDWQYARNPVLFLAVGTLLGLVVQRRLDRLRRITSDLDRLRQENRSLEVRDEELRSVNLELANRVVGATDTLPLLVRHAKQLNTLDLDEIYTALTQLVMEVLRAQQVSVYVLEAGAAMNLHSRNGQRREGEVLHLPRSVADRLLVDRQVVTVQDLATRGEKVGGLVLAGPLSAGQGGDAVAVLAVERLEFLRFNPAAVRLFNVVIEWAAGSVQQALRFRETPEELRRLQNKVSILRAERGAALAPALTAAATMHFGDLMSRGVAAGVIEERPTTARPVRPEAAGAAAPFSTGTFREIIAGANAKLFGELEDQMMHAAAQHTDGRSALRQLLTNELSLAHGQGKALARLLAEVDGFVGQGTASSASAPKPRDARTRGDRSP